MFVRQGLMQLVNLEIVISLPLLPKHYELENAAPCLAKFSFVVLGIELKAPEIPKHASTTELWPQLLEIERLGVNKSRLGWRACRS